MRELQHASAQGDNKEVRWLLGQGWPVDGKDLKDQFHAHEPAQMAATNGKTNTLRILKAHGADFFSYTRTGMTLEELSDKHGHHECSKYIRKVKEEETIKELMEEYSD
ncbi:MAG: hypothetical protein KGH60_03690 [Candidatus Micrarchaeota archaeon]|nr:hypothetical protein [Candidatus Micrarchaeota archaeon]